MNHVKEINEMFKDTPPDYDSKEEWRKIYNVFKSQQHSDNAEDFCTFLAENYLPPQDLM